MIPLSKSYPDPDPSTNSDPTPNTVPNPDPDLSRAWSGVVVNTQTGYNVAIAWVSILLQDSFLKTSI